jgi:molybdopterin/thiamine biosynthesis adenylyltransferase
MHLNDSQKERYERHILLPEVGEEGQERLLESRVLLVGAGGLGSPVALYLAAAGIGTLGVVDNDEVSLSNLQRQVLHSTVGVAKVYSASEVVAKLNPGVRFIGYDERLTSENIDSVVDPGWDVVVDACDNLETRYLINEACVKSKIPWVHGAVSQYEGQVTTFTPPNGPCYRCIYPNLDRLWAGYTPRLVGVLNVVPGMIGMIQATEVLKIILEIGTSLTGRMLNFEALSMTFQELPLQKFEEICPVCSPIRR